MKRFGNILILLLFYSVVLGQVSRKEITGIWLASNNNSLYYQADTLRFYKNLERFEDANVCKIKRWSIWKNSFEIEDVHICSEPLKITSTIEKEILKMTKEDYGLIISVESEGKLMDKFKIVDVYETLLIGHPHQLNELRLMRFDNLQEQKLYKYVDSLIYKVIKYDSTFVDSTYLMNLDSKANASLKMRTELGYEPNPQPIILLNGYVLNNKEILKSFRLVEAIDIKCLTAEQTVSIYGYHALNGVIVIVISNKRFKKEWRNFNK